MLAQTKQKQNRNKTPEQTLIPPLLGDAYQSSRTRLNCIGMQELKNDRHIALHRIST